MRAKRCTSHLFETFDDPAIDVTPAVNNTNLYHPEHEKKAKGNTRNCSYWFSGSMDIIIRRGLASGYAFEDGSAALFSFYKLNTVHIKVFECKCFYASTFRGIIPL